MAKGKRKNSRQKRPLRRQTSASPLWVPALLFLVAGALYLNTLGHGFVFDDHSMIVQNLTVTQTDWVGILFGGEYRPVRTLTYALNYAISGLDPFGYHLFNLLLHATAVVFLFSLIRSLTGSLPLAVVAALLFAVHPAQTAAVAYVSGRKDILATVFLLLGLGLLTGEPRRRAAGLVCLALAVLSKEVAVIAPLLLVIVVSARRIGSREEQPGALLETLRTVASRHRLTLAIAAGLVAGLASWAVFVREASRMEGLWGGSWSTNLGTSFKLFVHYLSVALSGGPLIADYSGNTFPVSTGLTEPATLAATALTLAYVAAAVWLFPRTAWVSAGLLWFLVALLPVLQIIPFHELAADHFLYLPLAGLALAAAATVHWLASRQPLLAWGLVGLVVVAGSIRTWQRNPVWSDRATLWMTTLQDAPRSYRANQGAAVVLNEQGRFSEAVALAQRVVEIEPDGTALANLAGYQFRLGQRHREAKRLDEARPLLELADSNIDKALALEPENPFFLNTKGLTLRELALVAENRGEDVTALELRKQAAGAFRAALASTEPRTEIQTIWLNFAGIFQEMEDFETARHYIEHFLLAFPDEPTGNFNLGEAFVKTGDFAEAIPYLEKGLAADPTSIEGWDHLGKAYIGTGRPEEAADAYRRALPHSNRPAEVHFNLGTIYAGMGDFERARQHLEQALTANPNGPLVPRILQKLSEVRSAADPGAG